MINLIHIEGDLSGAVPQMGTLGNTLMYLKGTFWVSAPHRHKEEEPPRALSRCWPWLPGAEKGTRIQVGTLSPSPNPSLMALTSLSSPPKSALVLFIIIPSSKHK